ncbi:MAG TPA: hypothetical protein DHV85_10455 [Candidatus Accumulibacter sp.]|nr:hypothetical protein [Accumulibacter sp.]
MLVRPVVATPVFLQRSAPTRPIGYKQRLCRYISLVYVIMDLAYREVLFISMRQIILAQL